MTYTRRFEDLKAAAKKQLARNLGAWVDPSGFTRYEAFTDVEMLTRITIDEGFRSEIIQIMKREHPRVRLTASTLADATVSLVHKMANDLIDQWDVRQVRGLIRAFPDMVPTKYRNRPIVCEVEDSEDGPWLIHFMEPTT